MKKEHYLSLSWLLAKVLLQQQQELPFISHNSLVDQRATGWSSHVTG
jgi:hypothetical protein